MKQIGLGLALVALMAVSAHGAASYVRVKTGKVILRLDPSFKSEKVAQVNEGEVLVCTAVEGEWVQVLPPTNVFFWVHSSFVTNNTATGARVRVRTGPSVNQRVVIELQKGERVVTRDSEGDWLRIDPPRGCVLWVNRALVDRVAPPPAPAPGRDVKSAKEAPRRDPVPGAVTTSVAIAASQTPAPAARSEAAEEAKGPPELLVRMGLIPLEGQGRTVRYEGVVVRCGIFSSGPTDYRLDTQERGRRKTVCYLMTGRAHLSGFTGKKVVADGREYWVKGEYYPVVVPVQIDEEPEQPTGPARR